MCPLIRTQHILSYHLMTMMQRVTKRELCGVGVMRGLNDFAHFHVQIGAYTEFSSRWVGQCFRRELFLSARQPLDDSCSQYSPPSPDF